MGPLVCHLFTLLGLLHSNNIKHWKNNKDVCFGIIVSIFAAASSISLHLFLSSRLFSCSDCILSWRYTVLPKAAQQSMSANVQYTSAVISVDIINVCLINKQFTLILYHIIAKQLEKVIKCDISRSLGLKIYIYIPFLSRRRNLKTCPHSSNIKYPPP